MKKLIDTTLCTEFSLLPIVLLVVPGMASSQSTFALLWQARNGGFSCPFEDRRAYPSPKLFSRLYCCRASLGGNFSSDGMISMDQQLCFALFSLNE